MFFHPILPSCNHRRLRFPSIRMLQFMDSAFWVIFPLSLFSLVFSWVFPRQVGIATIFSRIRFEFVVRLLWEMTGGNRWWKCRNSLASICAIKRLDYRVSEPCSRMKLHWEMEKFAWSYDSLRSIKSLDVFWSAWVVDCSLRRNRKPIIIVCLGSLTESPWKLPKTSPQTSVAVMIHRK